MSRVVVSVIGQDRTGIVAGISKVLAENNVNILDISQTIMDNLFAMIMLVDISNAKVDFATLKKELEKTGDELGVKVIVQHEDIFKYMHRI
jgi:ACT domain-containing protein